MAALLQKHKAVYDGKFIELWNKKALVRVLFIAICVFQ